MQCKKKTRTTITEFLSSVPNFKLKLADSIRSDSIKVSHFPGDIIEVSSCS